MSARNRVSAAVLALAGAVWLVAALGCGVAESIDDVRDFAGDVADNSQSATARPQPHATVGASPESAEVQSLIAILGGLRVADRGSDIEYNRRHWRHWIDDDRDCQNTRAEVLIDESVSSVAFAPEDDGDQCRVISGEWVGPWTGKVFTDASDVDIDHHVPLGHAHVSGGWQWSPERKRAYANDLVEPASLQATSARVNRSKGKQPPDQWRPEEVAGWCRYAADWIVVKDGWDLTVTSAEIVALKDMLETCDSVSSWGLAGSPEP